MNGISKLLSTDGFIQVNKALIKKLGLHEAIIIGELCAEYNYWEEQGKLDKDDMFYSSRSNIEENTGLSEHQQRKAMTTLKEYGILEIEKRGIPAVNYYKINFDLLLSVLSTSASNFKALDTKNLNSNNNKQTKITKEKVVSKDTTTKNFQFGKTQSKPKKDNLYSKCVSLIDSYPFDESVRKLLIEYLQFRLSVKEKPLYSNMWKGMLNKLRNLTDDHGYTDASLCRSIISQSIERGYLSFYPISNYSNGGVKSESGTRHVPRMTEEDYIEEEKKMAELEAKGIQVRF